VRLVLDTNVVLSALLWRGSPYHLLRATRQHGEVRLFTSAALVTELAGVLNRPFAAKRLALLERTALGMVADYLVAADLVVPSAAPRVVMADADDDHVIAACVAAAADLLVSGDRHLLTVGQHRGTRVVTPAEALRLIGAA
jgi:putative PIN family toxin of toxin-antitoxin system